MNTNAEEIQFVGDNMNMIGAKIKYLPATNDPLSADVYCIEGDEYCYVYDVGNNDRSLQYINQISKEKVVVLSHHHKDHTGNIAGLHYRDLYVGKKTHESIGKGIIIENRECFDDIRPVIDRLLSNLVEKNYPSEAFYGNLWDSINNDFLFDSDLEKICAVLFVLLSSKIPYFQMEEALRMSDDEYWEVSREVDEQYKKAVFALNRGYDQRTEVASQIVRFFKEIEGETQQVVYIAKLIGYFRFEIHRLEEKIKELYSKIDAED